MPVDRIEDIMNYYHFGMIPLYCLALVALLLFLGSLKTKVLWKYAIVGSIITIFSCISHMFFLGVLADNQAVTEPWTLHTYLVAGLNIVLLLILIVKRFKKK
ncbi:MAG: hypothetical protein HFI39_11870 [Lachnospiraceae bacterium]|nr:hypothetical protein [Lachnospiraceae bacterium]